MTFEDYKAKYDALSDRPHGYVGEGGLCGRCGHGITHWSHSKQAQMLPASPSSQPTATLDREVGNVCDRWDMMPNDLKGYLREQNENFCRAMDALLRAAEQK